MNKKNGSESFLIATHAIFRPRQYTAEITRNDAELVFAMCRYGQRGVHFDQVLIAGGPPSLAVDKTKIIHV